MRAINKIFIHENFFKSVPLEKREKVKRLCEKLEHQLRNSETGIYDTSIAYQSRKFHNKKALFKFRASDGDRIMFTYTTYLENYREEYGNGIYLIEYISQHDEQGRKAKNFDETITTEITYENIFSQNINIEIEQVVEKEYESYEQYLDLEKTMVYIKDEKDLMDLFNENNELAEVYISNQQSKYAMDVRANLLLGGAGSGKTLVSLHKLNNYHDSIQKIAYFTYTEALKNKSEKIFRKISDSDEAVEFLTISDYCLEKLKTSESKFIEFEWFDKNFKNIFGSMSHPSNINRLDIWSEIRGIIKGYMWDNWNRNYPFSFKEIDGKSRDILENKYHYIEAYYSDDRQIICKDTSIDCFNDKARLLDKDLEIDDMDKAVIYDDLKKVFELSTTFEYEQVNKPFDPRILPLEMYLGLKNEVSIYSKQDREFLHKACTRYQHYLDKNNLYDDNDLAGLSLIEILKDNKNKYSFIAVDEAQDLTELQVYLLYNLVDDKQKILLAGDVHQIINPTYFSNSRIKKLFSVNGKEIHENYLTKNYRSQKNIVGLANRLGEIRRVHIAKVNEENEQLEEAMNEAQTLFYLKNNKENLKNILLNINEIANAATIVDSLEDKEYLESLMKVKANNIYTVSEIKGLEFDYIFCYNLVGKYSEFWDEILEGKAKKNAKYRYYFNIFYVAITRARKHLWLYDETENRLLGREIADFFEYIEEYNSEDTYLLSSSDEWKNWNKRAKESEESENYEKAILAYKKGNADNSNIVRCMAKMKAKEKDYKSALDMMMQIEEYGYANKYAIASGNDEMIVLTTLIEGTDDYTEIENKYGKAYIHKILLENILDSKYMEKINFNYIENHLLLNMLEDISKIDTTIKKMLGE